MNIHVEKELKYFETYFKDCLHKTCCVNFSLFRWYWECEHLRRQHFHNLL